MENGEKRKLIAVLIAAVIAATATVMFAAIWAEAKGPDPIDEKYTTANGDTFIIKNGRTRTGWVTWRGSTYYCHKTESLNWPKGSVYTGGFKILRGRWYCFDSLGRLVTKDTKSLDIRSKDHSVRYIYTDIGMAPNSIRYSTAARRYQEKDSEGRWRDVGMEVIPAGWADTQR